MIVKSYAEAVNNFRSFYSHFNAAIATTKNLVVKGVPNGLYISCILDGQCFGQFYNFSKLSPR